MARPVMESKRVQIYLAMLLTDAVILFGSFVLSGGIYRNEWPLQFAVAMAWAVLPIFIVIAVYQRCYSIRALDEVRFAIGQVALALVITAMLCTVMIFYAKAATDFSRVMLSLALVLTFLGIGVSRTVMRAILRKRYGPTMSSILLVLDGGPQVDVPGAEVVKTNAFDIAGARADPRALDKIGRLIRGADRVVVSCKTEARAEWATLLRSAGVRGEVLSPVVQELGAIAIGRVDGNASLVVSSGPLALHARLFKRALDLVITVPALLLLSPILLLVALLIKLEDGGPVFFVQPRMGQHNCLFKMLKFRSMRVDKGDHEGARSTSRSDDRITKIGRFIRKTSIDELPQLINVLRSEMSLVGPRPHALGSHAGDKLFWEVDSEYWQRHSLKPGLTGLAQVRGHRGATETESHLVDRLGADLEYIRNWSLWGDIKILFATVRVVVHPNAY
ncbi:exopolysaccharide biosynthesis polyprenyl glycosylphosphotransferase [Qipengyuania sp. XHP0207]|uniref:exopolysaccharide biosynthesis polyprenyl glycosylphosphotransferase n=1 Tax=Qipengyuania sp. XHP0207 TaxID=3038078 RepID=UPI00241CEAB1|nr:exopolysaccharide biosynthesis polyprenyl glycosylphosphotransferase [Qipengyuania sp. XHP0207]MDG5747267.1 exopolysaccharide biosynthesis polyprenyl glycosylphosphotransferase [Qipengyuania sp. XHP0207]